MKKLAAVSVITTALIIGGMIPLANANAGGWNLITERDPQVQVAQIQVIIRSGSLADPALKPGLANFTARALLRGTLTRPYKDLTSSIERLGASVAVRADQDLTIVRASVLVRNFDALLDILRDLLTQPAFDSIEMSTLQNILQGEIRSNLQDPQELASRALLSTAYQGTQASHSPDGTLDGVSRITPQELFAYFKAHYTRRNMVIGVVSPFEDSVLAKKLSSKLDTVPEGTLDSLPLPSSTWTGRRGVIVNRKGMATTPVFIAVPGVGDSDADLTTLELGNFVFGGDFTSRLMQVLRAENGWTYGVSSSYRQLISAKAEPSLFSIYLFPSAEFAGLAIPKSVSMLEEYSSKGLTADEFAKAREALGNSYAFNLATAEQRLAMRVRQALTGRIFENAEDYAKRLAALDLASVNSVIARKTQMSPLIITAVGDAEVLKPILRAIPGMGPVEIVEPDTREDTREQP